MPLEKRMADVRQFLQDIDDSLQYDVVAIQDAYGPTATDPNMDVSTFLKYTWEFLLKILDTPSF